MKRAFAVILLWAGLCLPAVAQFVPPGISPTETEKLADGLYAFRWGAYRSIFIVTDEGVIVTDPIAPDAAVRYREEIAKITDKPVKYVVYSHSHWDHARGGKIFKDEGATFISQERCVQNFIESPNPDIVMPDITFKDEYKLRLGNGGIDLYYFGPSHDTCLAVMVAQPANMLYSVDIVSPPEGRYFPWDPQVADFHFYNAVNYLRGMEALVAEKNISTFVGAHLVVEPAGKGIMRGKPSTGPVSAITERRVFWEQIMAAVKAEMDAGTESFMVSGKIDMEPFRDVRGFNPKKMKILVDRIAAYYSIGH